MNPRMLVPTLILTMASSLPSAHASCRNEFESYRDAQEAFESVCPGEEGSEQTCETLQETRDDAFDDWMDCQRTVETGPQ